MSLDTSKPHPAQGGTSRLSSSGEQNRPAGPAAASGTLELHLATIFKHSRDAIWSWDINGLITQWNPAAERLLGYRADEIIGRPILTLVPPERRVAIDQAILKLRQGIAFEQHETARIGKDGAAVAVEISVTPVLDEDGRLVGATTVCRDVRDRKQVAATLAKRVKELTTIHGLTEQLQLAASLSEIYEAALQAILDALECDRASILLYDAAGVMRFVAWRGLSDGYRHAVDGHSPWTKDTLAPDPIFVSDILLADEPPALKARIAEEGIRGLAFIPLVKDGRLIGKFMTYYRTPHVFTEDEKHLAGTIARQLALAIARQRTEDELRNSEARFRLMAENAPVMIWISDAAGQCVHLNRMLRRFWGLSEDPGAAFDWSATLHPDDVSTVGQTMANALHLRQPVQVKARYRDSGGSYRVLATQAHPYFTAAGEFQGMIGVNADVTDSEEVERARELLVGELNHRMKNTLAIVQSLAHQTFRGAGLPSDVLAAFEKRLIALGHAHNLLTQANWEHASLKEIADITLGAQEASARRISIAGPKVLLPPKQAVSLSMALHELCTNALKYGALSNSEGRVSLQWDVTGVGAQRLRLQWRESGGPPVEPPDRRGFGSLLLERTLARDLDGEVAIEFAPTGLVCSVVASIPPAGEFSSSTPR